MCVNFSVLKIEKNPLVETQTTYVNKLRVYSYEISLKISRKVKVIHYTVYEI